jgi:hypothetical protein
MKRPSRKHVKYCLAPFKQFLYEVNGGRVTLLDDIPVVLCDEQYVPISDSIKNLIDLFNVFDDNIDVAPLTILHDKIITQSVEQSDIDNAFAFFNLCEDMLVRVPMTKVIDQYIGTMIKNV